MFFLDFKVGFPKGKLLDDHENTSAFGFALAIFGASDNNISLTKP